MWFGVYLVFYAQRHTHHTRLGEATKSGDASHVLVLVRGVEACLVLVVDDLLLAAPQVHASRKDDSGEECGPRIGRVHFERFVGVLAKSIPLLLGTATEQIRASVG